MIRARRGDDAGRRDAVVKRLSNGPRALESACCSISSLGTNGCDEERPEIIQSGLDHKLAAYTGRHDRCGAFDRRAIDVQIRHYNHVLTPSHA